MSLDQFSLLVCGVEGYEENRRRRPRVSETENDTGIDAGHVGFQAQLAADLIKVKGIGMPRTGRSNPQSAKVGEDSME